MGRKKDPNRLTPMVLRDKEDKVVHSRRNMWGRMIRPGEAYGNYKENVISGWYHPDHKWKHVCKAFRKKVRKMKIAKLSRKGSRKRIKRAR